MNDVYDSLSHSEYHSIIRYDAYFQFSNIQFQVLNY